MTIAPVASALERNADAVAERALGAHPQPQLSSRIQPVRGASQLETMDRASTSRHRAIGTGMPLETGIRRDMEGRFGSDFSQVRVHADLEGAHAAERLNASAYTSGRDVVFGAGEFRPETDEGRRLLAHELAHVVQQSQAHWTYADRVQRKPGRGKKAPRNKERTVIAIHAEPLAKVGTALFAGTDATEPIELTSNDLDAGDYEMIRRDDPSTDFVEYTHSDGRTLAISWKTQNKWTFGADRVDVIIRDGTPDFDDFADEQFRKVPDYFKKALSKKGAPQLRTAPEKIGFASFAEELERLGVDEGDLLRFQAQNFGVFDPKRRFDWANDWMRAVDLVAGAKAHMDRRSTANEAAIGKGAKAFSGTPENVLSLYKASLDQDNPILDTLAQQAFEEAGLDRSLFETERLGMLEAFDDQLRLETTLALDKFEGALRLARQYLRSQDAAQRVATARAAAATPAIEDLREKKVRARAERKTAQKKHAQAELAARMIGKKEQAKEAKKVFAEKDAAYTQAREGHRAALAAVSGIRVESLQGFDEDRFFYEGSVTESQRMLETYVNDKLHDVAWARTKLDDDPRTIYKADVMVAFTKSRMNVTPGSEADQLIDQRVEEWSSAPWWSKLLDVLSIALIFVPGGAVVVALRLGVSALQLVSEIDQQVVNEGLNRAGTKQEGGSAAAIVLTGLGTAFDVVDAAKIARATGLVGHTADDAAKLAAGAGDAAAASDEAAEIAAKGDAAAGSVDDVSDVAAKAETPHTTPASADAPPSAVRDEVPPTAAVDAPPRSGTYTHDQGFIPSKDVPQSTIPTRTRPDAGARPKPPKPYLNTAEKAAAKARQNAARAHLDDVRAKGLPRGSIGESWDYKRFPDGPGRRWRPGDPPNMPRSDGSYPSWRTIRERIWKNLSHGELEARKAGTAVRSRVRGPDIDPTAALSDRDLRRMRKTGKARPEFEIEHAQIPQRMARLFERAGMSRTEARRIARLGDKSNLDVVPQEVHAVLDDAAHSFGYRNRALPAAFDERRMFPLGSMQPPELAELVEAIKKAKIDLSATEAGLELREILKVEKERWGAAANWEVP